MFELSLGCISCVTNTNVRFLQHSSVGVGWLQSVVLHLSAASSSHYTIVRCVRVCVKSTGSALIMMFARIHARNVVSLRHRVTQCSALSSILYLLILFVELEPIPGVTSQRQGTLRTVDQSITEPRLDKKTFTLTEVNSECPINLIHNLHILGLWEETRETTHTEGTYNSIENDHHQLKPVRVSTN